MIDHFVQCMTILMIIFLGATRVPAQPFPPLPLSGAEPVKRIVEDAIAQGGKVILERVDYAPEEEKSALMEGDRGGVRSKTYIEIDTRPGGSNDEKEVMKSQQKIDESQKEMIKAMESLEDEHKRMGTAMSSIDGRQRDAAAGMKSEAEEQTDIRGEAARTGSAASDSGEALQDSGALLSKIHTQVKELSGAVNELSSRVEQGSGNGSKDSADSQTDSGIDRGGVK